MSQTTETLHVRGITRARFLDAVFARMKEQGWTHVPGPEGFDPTDPEVRRLVMRRDGKWLTLADGAGFDRRMDTYGPENEIQGWGEQLSRALGRSVLTIWTWDGEAAVRATRWKRGTSRGSLNLLQEAYRGPDGHPYASAKIFWPWLPRERRDAILAKGIKLVEPGGEPTGDAELDELLAGFDDADGAEVSEDDDPDHVFVDESISVPALARAVGMRHPLLNPWMPDDGDEELVFHR